MDGNPVTKRRVRMEMVARRLADVALADVVSISAKGPSECHQLRSEAVTSERREEAPRLLRRWYLSLPAATSKEAVPSRALSISLRGKILLGDVRWKSGQYYPFV